MTLGMRDRFGTPDPTPAVWTWTVDLSPIPAPAPPPAADADADGVPDARDNCVSAANSSQADGDGDGVGDACEVGAPGNLAPVTGERVVATVLSGEVFIKLPATRSLKQSAPISGFVPLKGQAALPIGTVVDTRKGRMSMASTVDGRRIGSGGRTQTAIPQRGHLPDPEQRKAALGSAAKVSTDLVLQSRARCRGVVREHRRFRADQGPRPQHRARADGVDRQGPVPDRRRGRDEHRHRRDVGDQGPLRRHPHRRRQGLRPSAQPRDRQDDHGQGRPLVSGQGEALQGEARPRS